MLCHFEGEAMTYQDMTDEELLKDIAEYLGHDDEVVELATRFKAKVEELAESQELAAVRLLNCQTYINQRDEAYEAIRRVDKQMDNEAPCWFCGELHKDDCIVLKVTP